VVDDDESVRDSVPDQLREPGFEVRAFASGDDFLSPDCVNGTRCLILDAGFDLQRELGLRGQKIPIILITAVESEAVRRSLSNRELWGSCSSHSTTRLCYLQSRLRFEFDEGLLNQAANKTWKESTPSPLQAKET
jgi:hypothetical protein